MKSPVRVGIIGLGRSGWDLHAATIATLPQEFEVVSVADSSAERRNEAKARFGCEAQEEPSALIREEGIELVVVATPSHTHCDLTVSALENQKHVLVEKPMATSAAEADRMVEAAQNTGKQLSVYQVRRKAADFMKVQEIVQSGVLGPLHLIKMNVHGYSRRRDWQTLKKFGGGILNNTGAHFIDQAFSLAGGQWSQLFADVRHLVSAGDADDHIKVVFRGAEGVTVDVEISTAAANPVTPSHWTILGRYGALAGTTSELTWKYHNPDEMPERAVQEVLSERVYEGPEKFPWVEEHAAVNDDHRTLHRLFYEDLYAALREGAALPAPGAEVRHLIALFDACREQSAV